jgi:hypothetical protein
MRAGACQTVAESQTNQRPSRPTYFSDGGQRVVQWLALAAEAAASASINPPELPPNDEGKPAEPDREGVALGKHRGSLGHSRANRADQ